MIKFRGIKLDYTIERYRDGMTCIQLWTGGAPYTRATRAVEMPDSILDAMAAFFKVEPEQIVLIKNVDENQDILQALMDAGIVSDTGDLWPCGYYDLNVCILEASCLPEKK